MTGTTLEFDLKDFAVAGDSSGGASDPPGPPKTPQIREDKIWAILLICLGIFEGKKQKLRRVGGAGLARVKCRMKITFSGT